MMVSLPDDILFLICGELANLKDFDSLLRCALASKALTANAIPWLYRTSQESPIRDGGSEALSLPQQYLVVQKWTIFWRSIILSSLDSGSTFMSYSRYLRVLDLRDLEGLLGDDKFKGKISSYFFEGPLKTFVMRPDAPSKSKLRHGRVPDILVEGVVNDIGEAIYKTAPMLEKVTGKVQSESLARWTPSLTRLRSLELWYGKVLASNETRSIIQGHCPNFSSLSLYTWDQDEADTDLAAFFHGLAADSLQSFEIISNVGIGAATFKALNCHSKSLTELKLCLAPEALPQLSSLSDCTSLRILQVSERDGFRTNLEASHREEFDAIVAWLGNCKRLETANFAGLVAGPALMTPILKAGEVQLRELELEFYHVGERQELHLALPQQRSLRSLSLAGEYEELAAFETEIFVDALSRIQTLRELKLRGVSEPFTDAEIDRIATHMPELEDLYISGGWFTDAALDSISMLERLKSVTFNTITTFTYTGLKAFVSKLQPGNQGMSFFVDMADQDSGLTPTQQGDLREEFSSQIGGRFEYQFLRDPDVSEFEGESD